MFTVSLFITTMSSLEIEVVTAFFYNLATSGFCMFLMKQGADVSSQSREIQSPNRDPTQK